MNAVATRPDPRDDYWCEAMECAFEDAGLWDAIKDIPRDKRMEVGASLRISAECVGQAFHVPESPLIAENARLERKLIWQRELETCGECKGRGSLSYYAGPWWCTSQCDTCHGSGKVHPHGEREPA